MKRLSPSLLAKKVMDARKEQKISQRKLAELTGINRGMIVRLEAQDYIPSIPQLETLGETLGFEPTSLFIPESKINTLEKCSPLNIAVAGTGYVQEPAMSGFPSQPYWPSTITLPLWTSYQTK